MSSVKIVFGVVAAVLFVSANASLSGAKTINRSAPTSETKGISRSADGTITLEGRYTSPNPHCLEAKRWRKLSDGYYHEGFDAYPVFGGEIGTAPNGGYLAPISPFGRSPLIWKAVWPGTSISHVGPPADFKKIPISEANLVKFFYWIPHSGRPGLPAKAYYTTYMEHGNRVNLTCGVKSSDHKTNYPL